METIRRNPLKLSLRHLRAYSSCRTSLYVTAPRIFKRDSLRICSLPPSPPTIMPAPTLPRRKVSPLPPMSPYTSDVHMMDAKSLHFDYPVSHDADPMLFDFDDVSFPESAGAQYPWDMHDSMDMDIKPVFDMSSRYGFDQQAASDNYFDSSGFYSPDGINESPSFNNDLYLSNWVHDMDMPPPSSPIPIPTSSSSQSPHFATPAERSQFSTDKIYSPANFAALHPLPSSASPSSFDGGQCAFERPRVDSISPSEMSINTPNWATQLWDPAPKHARASSSRSPVRRHSPLSSTQRLRIPRHDTVSPVGVFQSSSAPAQTPAPHMARSYSSKADSGIGGSDRDATIRRKRKTSDPAGVESKETDTRTWPVPRSIDSLTDWHMSTT